MKFAQMIFIAIGLLMIVPPSTAGEEPPEKDRDALREEMREARRELAEAARTVAELSRELGREWSVDIAHEAGGDERAFGWRMFAPDDDRAMLGITVGDDDDNDGGVEVLSVTPGGPADKAGMQAGDVITAIDDVGLVETDSPSRALIKAMREAEPGDEIEIRYRRGTDDRVVSMTAEAMPSRFAFVVRPDGHGPWPDVPHAPRPPLFLELMLGWGELQLAPVSPELGEYFGTDKGLLVVHAPDGEDLKLQDGDVILAIGGRELDDPRHAMRILGSYRGGESVTLDIVRKQKKMSLEIEIPERRVGMDRAPRMEHKIDGETRIRRIAPE